jgi:hypothetical protein
MVYLYVPLWYKKFNENVVPYVKASWIKIKEFANLTWIKSEPYREMIYVYYINAIEYVNELALLINQSDK